jgi:hypothetical protein
MPLSIHDQEGAYYSYSGEFTEDLKPENMVDFQRFFVTVTGETHKASMKYVSRSFPLLGNFQLIRVAPATSCEGDICDRFSSRCSKRYLGSISKQ